MCFPKSPAWFATWRTLPRAALLVGIGIPTVWLTLRADAQTPRWVELPPPPIARSSCFHDPAGARLIVVGYGPGAVDAVSIWAVTLDGSFTWTQLSTQPGSTFAFDPRAVILDPTRNRLVAVGRRPPSVPGPDVPNVSTFDLTSTGDWTPLATSGTIPTAADASYAYDPTNDRMVVFGGQVGGGTPSYTNSVSTLSFQGSPTWSTLTTLGTKPNGRGSASAIFDPVGSRMIFYGGVFYHGPTFSYVPMDESWVLSMTDPPTWKFLVPRTPVANARYRHAAALDATGHRMVVFGGLGASEVARNDAWALDLQGPADSATWVPLPAAPQTTSQMGACVDPGSSNFLVYGGIVPLTSSDRLASARLLALSLGNSPAWSSLAGPAGTFPGRFAHVGFIDASRSRMVVAAGLDEAWVLRSDTWVRPLDDDHLGWSSAGGGGVGARASAGAAMDVAGDRGLIFGGGSTGIQVLNDTREFDFASSVWTPLAPPDAPPGRHEALCVFDPTRRRMMVHAGADFTPSGRPHVLSDTWAFDAAAETWQLLSVGSYGGRWGVAGIYDPVEDRLVAFGGQDTLSIYGDVHELPLGPGGAWAPLATSGTPPSPSSTAIACYDPGQHRMLLFASLSGSSGRNALGVWSLSLADPPTWTQLNPNGRLPAARVGSVALLDETRGRLLVFGGLGGSSLSTTDKVADTWAFYLDETTPVQMSLVSTHAEPGRVTVVWKGDGRHASMTVFRQESGNSWRTLATLEADGEGFFTLEDRDILPGRRYTYRLGVLEGRGWSYFEPTTVEVPSDMRLALLGSRPSPCTGPLTVGFTLARAAPVRLDMFDLQGRRVWARDMEGLDAGAHLVRFGDSASLPSGLYVLRLTQGRELAYARVVLTR